MKLFRNIFEDKIVFLTGHTGFVGSWLAILLIESGAKVIGYALPPRTKDDNYEVSNLKEKMISCINDIRHYDKLINAFKKFKPDMVFHLAAQPIVRESYIIPRETYNINVGGTVNVFEAFRKTNSCQIMINFTTDKCYENRELKRGYREKDPLGGYDPYSSSKACSELITSAYKSSFFSNATDTDKKQISSVRCGNIIGGGDWQKDRLIPDIIRALNKNKDIIIRNPESVRPWQFILEPLRGLLILAYKMDQKKEKYSDAWNFGPRIDEKYTVKDIIEKIIKTIGNGSYKIQPKEDSDPLHETSYLTLDITKADEILGWKPLLSIDHTIRYICDWYMEDIITYDFNVNQINDYFKKIKIKKKK